MFVHVLAPLLGAFFISLSLINVSSNINPSLHSFLNEQLKQLQENSPTKMIKEIPFSQIRMMFSIYLFICGFVLYFSEGMKRLFVLIPSSILSIYMLQSAIIHGSTLSNVPLYLFIVVCIIFILFNDCAQLDGLEIK